MKLKKLKSAIAGFTAFAMAVTMLPTGGLGSVHAASTDGDMILHWDMTTVDGDATHLKDLTGNQHNGVIHDSVSTGNIDGIDVVDLTGGYVDIPDGTIGTDATAVTVNMLVKITENVKSSWMFCLGSSNTKYLYLTACSNQDTFMRGGAGNGSPGWSHESSIGGKESLTVNEWQNITVTYQDGGKFIFYKNGTKQAETVLSEGAAGEFTLQDLMTAGDGKDGYMGWSFYEANDPKFKGKVADFRIYNKAMSDTEVAELSTEIDQMLDNLTNNDFGASDIDLTEEDCLGTNTSKDDIRENLVLPTTTTLNGLDNKVANITNWESSDPEVIATDGKVTRADTNKTVTLTATVERNGVTALKTLTFKVPLYIEDSEAVKRDSEALNIPNMDDIRGNVSLPSKGAYGSTITWTSSNDAVINSKDSGSILAGAVTRPADADTKVTLTANVALNGEKAQQTFECTVKKAYTMPETTDYIFAYFPYVDGHFKDERIYFGISQDGLNFSALNNGKFVLESKLGTHGLRDPFIIRSHEGDRFFLIATDLTVAGIEQDGTKYPGQGWGQNQTQGSQKLMVWESTDLVNWSEQRECKVAKDNAGCTWAPEAYWDDATGQYVVFWSSKTGDDNYTNQRLYYATTRDFYNFSEANVWIEAKGSVIDTTVIKVGEYYYRYTKNEDGAANIHGTPSKRVYCERSKSLTSTEWELVHNNSLDVSGGQIEGPCIFKLNNDDVENAKMIAGLKNFNLTGDDIYCLMADMTGVTIFPGLSDDITTGNFNVLGTTKSAEVDGTPLYSMPEPDASHGTVMPITTEEYNNLILNNEKATKADAALAELTLETTEVTSDLTLPSSTSNGATVTWASSNEDLITSAGKVTRPTDTDTEVTLTATITVKGNDVVSDEVRTKKFELTVKKAVTSSDELSSIADAALAELTLETTIVTSDLTLPSSTSNGATVTWASSNEKLITPAGKVTRPEDKDTEVTLTATITVKGTETIPDEVRTKKFKVTVKKAGLDPKELKEKADAAAAELKLKTTTVTSNLKLPTSTSNGATVTWKSSNTKLITSTGKVTRPKDKDTKVTLTATITVKGDDTVPDEVRTKKFTVTVKKAVIQKYKVKFDSKGGSKVSTKTVTKGNKVAKPKNPTKKKYTFAGWYNGSKKYDFKKPVTKNLTLTAKWTKVKVSTPKTPTLKNKKSKQISVSFKKVSGAAGYQLTYTTDKKFKKGKKNLSSTKPSFTIRKLKKGKTYYIKVRAYKKDSTKSKVYGSYSGTKSVKIL